MNDELKYPRVYALLEMNKECFIRHTRFEETIGIVVSPCYLVGEKSTYYKDGTTRKEYDVVFPRTADDIFHDYFDKECIPEYNLDGYTNTASVSFVSSSYEEAIKKRNEMIEKNIFNGIHSLLPLEPIESFSERCDEYLKKIEEYQQRLNNVESIEQVKTKIKTPANK